MIKGCKTKKIEFIDCAAPGFSFFHDCIPRAWKRDGLFSDNPLHRICSLMRKMQVKSFCYEELETNGCMEGEFKALSQKIGASIEGEIIQLSFFNKQISSIDDLEQGRNKSFLGYAVIINAKHPDGTYTTYIPQSVIKTPTIYNTKLLTPDGVNKTNQYIHTAKYFKAFIDNKELELYGCFYCQQNGLTNACAHASLRMVINNLPTESYNIDYEDINKILSIVHTNDKEQSAGLTQEQIKQVLKSYNLGTITQNYFSEPNMHYEDFVYTIVESGYPCLLVFTTDTDSHVVPIVGHTLNTDIWYPEAKFYYRSFSDLSFHPSNSWVDHFVMHDDNLGMYYNLPTSALNRITLPSADPNFRVYCAIGILPEGINFSPSIAQRDASSYLESFLSFYKDSDKIESRWLDAFLCHDSQNRFPVIRTLLINKKDYIDHLKEISVDYPDEAFDFIDEALGESEWFWLNEITLPDLYTANKTKVGDILIKASTEEGEEKEKTYRLLRLAEIMISPQKEKIYTHPTEVSHHDIFCPQKNDAAEFLDW